MKNYSDEAKKYRKETEKFIESSEKGMKNIRVIGINSVIDGRSDLQTRIYPGKSQEKKTKNFAVQIRNTEKFFKNMPEFPPVFVQKIFCFVQIPKSFVQKHETTTGETERNLEELSSNTHGIVHPETKNNEKLSMKEKCRYTTKQRSG